jgi:protein SCO1/2
MKARLAVLLLLLATPAIAAPAPDLRGFAYQQRPGSQLPLDAEFRDETGRALRFREITGGKSLILALVYFNCPNLCGIVRTDLFDALSKTGMTAGRDYALIALSIDPSETPPEAKAAKTDDMARYPLPGAEAGWHFLTGAPEAVQAVADAVGFRDKFDPQLKQFVHPAGVVFVTPKGVVSSYLLGVGYAPADVRLGVTRADLGTIAAAALPVLLLCYHYDPQTGRYTLSILKLLRLGAVITVLAMGGTLYLAFRRERSRA